MTAHLGPAATAFVDGQLDHRRRDEVLAHLIHCAPVPRRRPRRPRRSRTSLRARGAGRSRSTSASGCWRRRSRPPQRASSANPLASTGASAVPRWGVLLSFSASVGPSAWPAHRPAGPPAKVDPSSVRFVIDHATTAGEVPFSEPEVVPVSSAQPAAVRIVRPLARCSPVAGALPDGRRPCLRRHQAGAPAPRRRLRGLRAAPAAVGGVELGDAALERGAARRHDPRRAAAAVRDAGAARPRPGQHGAGAGRTETSRP